MGGGELQSASKTARYHWYFLIEDQRMAERLKRLCFGESPTVPECG